VRLDLRKTFALLGQADCSAGGKQVALLGSEGWDQQYKVHLGSLSVRQQNPHWFISVLLTPTKMNPRESSR